MEVNSLLLVLRCCLPVAILDNAQQTEMIGKLFRRNGGSLQEKKSESRYFESLMFGYLFRKS